jgi:hypothetical protein
MHSQQNNHLEVPIVTSLDGNFSDAELLPTTSLIYVAQCDLGWGLFAATNITPYVPILLLTGPIISAAQARDKGTQSGNPLQIGIDEYIDLDPPGVYLNHSCEPNAAIVRDRVLISLRAIRQDEELRFDYSTTMSEDDWTMECRCGAVTCRGTIRDFECLPPDMGKRYLAEGIVQSFIRRRSGS